MPTYTKIIAATLALTALMGNAQAQNPASQSTSVPLGVAVATQGNQALVDIRSSVTESIPLSIQSLMAMSLPADRMVNDHEHETSKENATYVAALAVAR